MGRFQTNFQLKTFQFVSSGNHHLHHPHDAVRQRYSGVPSAGPCPPRHITSSQVEKWEATFITESSLHFKMGHTNEPLWNLFVFNVSSCHVTSGTMMKWRVSWLRSDTWMHRGHCQGWTLQMLCLKPDWGKFTPKWLMNELWNLNLTKK